MAEDERGNDAPHFIREPDSGELRSIFGLHQQNRLFHQLSVDTRLTQRVSQILASKLYIHQSRINLKPAFEGKEFFWHSDFETWHVEDGMPRMRAVSCSIALTDTDLYNGALMLIPGSHQTFISCVGETPDEHFKQSLRRQEFGAPDREIIRQLALKNGISHFEGAAGSVILFDCNTLHASAGNLSPWPRNNLFFVFNSVHNRLSDPQYGLKPRPEYVASRQPTAVNTV